MKNIIQNDFSNNRYYLDNPTNFLILRELWLTQPKQYARMLSKKKPTRKRGMDSYNKYHPVYEWIMCMAKKYMLNSNTLTILDIVKFILQDRITFQKKHKPKINIYDIYPDTDTTDSKLKEIKKLINDNPMNWAWLISNVDKYKPLLNYINKHTPKLNSNKYSLTTKMKWILEGLTDFPKCANPHCSQILYNATSRTLVDDMTKYCSQKCVQESKSHKPHSFFVKRKYKQCIKYLNSIFESKESKYKIQYLKIIDKYLKLKLKKSKESNNVLNYVEKHHINPRWYFISNCIPIIDHDNIVIVPYYIHVKLHILLVQHFKYINDKRNYYKAVRACLAFYNTCKSSIRSLIRLPVKIQKQLEKIKQQYSKIQSVYSKSRKTVINVKTNQIKTVPFSYTNDNYEVLYINIDI